MLNEVYDTIETILEGLDTGGEPSRAYAEEIKMLKDVLGYPEPAADELELTLRRGEIARKLSRLAVLAEEMTVDLPSLPVTQWLDGTYKDPHVDVFFARCDLARLLQFIADVGVRPQV